MSNWYVNQITVKGTEAVMQTHRDIISEFVKLRNANLHNIEQFKFSILERTFLPDNKTHKWSDKHFPKYSEFDCKWAYLDERIIDGNYFKIISADGVPCAIQDYYLKLLSTIDPEVIIEMATITGNPNEDRIRYVQMLNSNLVEIKHGYYDY